MVGIGGSLLHFEGNARKDERQVVTIEKERVITRIVQEHQLVVVEKDAAIEQKQKEVNHVAKQRDAALAEIKRLRADADSAVNRLRESLAAAQAAAQGGADAAETQRRLIEAQGRSLADCGQQYRQLGERLEGLAEENRILRAKFEQLKR